MNTLCGEGTPLGTRTCHLSLVTWTPRFYFVLGVLLAAKKLQQLLLPLQQLLLLSPAQMYVETESVPGFTRDKCLVAGAYEFFDDYLLQFRHKNSE